jgi:phosphoribosyl-AMP cyclohydrolase
MTQMNADNQSTNLPVYQSASLPVSLSTCLPSALKWDERGLITTVVQDAASGQVLMVAWMNAEALDLTLATGETHFWSRSRGELWHKGATSGNVQRVVHLWADCDADTLLVQVEPAGPACHTGAVSCFYRAIGGKAVDSRLVNW